MPCSYKAKAAACTSVPASRPIADTTAPASALRFIFFPPLKRYTLPIFGFPTAPQEAAREIAAAHQITSEFPIKHLTALPALPRCRYSGSMHSFGYWPCCRATTHDCRSRHQNLFRVGHWRGVWHTPSSFSREELASLHSLVGARIQSTCTNKGEPDAKETLRDGSGGSAGHAGGCARAIGRAGLRHGAPVAEPGQVHQRYR